MAAAETLKLVHIVDNKVTTVLNGKHSMLPSPIQGTSSKTRICQLHRKETKKIVQHLASSVDDMNVCDPPLSSGHRIFNVFTGNQSRKSLKKWVSPPDPSINYYIASDIHHRGSAQWFFKGSIFAEWKSTGSLLWIYGKRTFFRSFADQPLITFCVLAGSGKTILWLVITQLLHLDEFNLPHSPSIVQDIVTLSKAGSASMAYFYFDFRDLDKQHIRS